MKKIYLYGFLALLFSGCQPVKEDGKVPNQFTDNMTDVLDGGVARPEYRKESNLYVKLAEEYFRLNIIGVALKNAKKALIVDASNAEAHLIAAKIYQKLESTDKRDIHYKMALKHGSNNYKIANAYASYLCDNKHYDEAQQYYDLAIKNPNNNHLEYVYANSGNCFLSANDLDKASVQLRKSLEIQDKFAPALLGMLNVRMKQKNYLSAQVFLKRYLKLTKHTAETLFLSIEIENELGHKDKAKLYKQRLLTEFADSPQAQSIINKK